MMSSLCNFLGTISLTIIYEQIVFSSHNLQLIIIVLLQVNHSTESQL